MEVTFPAFPDQVYAVAQPQTIATPRLLVFEQQVQHNVAAMARLLTAAGPGYSMSSLCPHVKTHKSVYITRMLRQAGVSFFKATPNETDMLLQAGASRIFIAYPLLPLQADAVARLVRERPDVEFFIQLARPEHAAWAEAAASRHDVRLHYFIDVNVGMHRTGLAPEQVWSFYESITSTRLQFSGLHAYDGHIHQETVTERSHESAQMLQRLQMAAEPFRAAGVDLEQVVVGGTPSFLTDAELYAKVAPGSTVFFSPGTFVYFDSQYARLMPGTFVPAALILAQIMDQPGDNIFTLNLGHKRWAVDQGPVEQFSIAGMKALRWSEEHTVVQVPAEAGCRLGDYVLMVPRHVCSTVNLWEYVTVIGESGEIRFAQCPIEGRNR